MRGGHVWLGGSGLPMRSGCAAWTDHMRRGGSVLHSAHLGCKMPHWRPAAITLTPEMSLKYIKCQLTVFLYFLCVFSLLANKSTITGHQACFSQGSRYGTTQCMAHVAQGADCLCHKTAMLAVYCQCFSPAPAACTASTWTARNPGYVSQSHSQCKRHKNTLLPETFTSNPQNSAMTRKQHDSKG